MPSCSLSVPAAGTSALVFDFASADFFLPPFLAVPVSAEVAAVVCCLVMDADCSPPFFDLASAPEGALSARASRADRAIFTIRISPSPVSEFDVVLDDAAMPGYPGSHAHQLNHALLSGRTGIGTVIKARL